MSKIQEMAMDLGRALGRTDEYQVLKRAAQSAEEDRELTRLREALDALEQGMMSGLRMGQEPEEAQKDEYESLARALQSQPEYQRLVSAQANFDKILQKVNETISRGIQDASQSRIILP
jgi:cell fate (sporulation/competence/biofilm development) regulator YlbF (YheA/YmcA/DUF963 family)